LLVLKLDDDIISTFLYPLSAALQAESRHCVNRHASVFNFLEIFSSHYCIPFWLSQISLFAKISVAKHCFIIAFSVFLLCVLQFVCCCLCCLYSPPRFCCLLPLCCATSAVVCVTFAPPVRLYLVFLRASVRRFLLFFEVAVYFLLLLLLLSPVLSVLLWCLLVAGVVIWFRGVLGVSCCVFLLVGCLVVWLCPRFCGAVASCVVGCCWCVLCLLFVFFCWFCFVLGCPLFCGPPGVAPVVFRVWLLFWLVVVVVLLCPLFCSWWCCSAVLVAGVFPLLCVAPSWCWLLLVGSWLLLVRVLLFWFFWW